MNMTIAPDRTGSSGRSLRTSAGEERYGADDGEIQRVPFSADRKVGSQSAEVDERLIGSEQVPDRRGEQDQRWAGDPRD